MGFHFNCQFIPIPSFQCCLSFLVEILVIHLLFRICHFSFLNSHFTQHSFIAIHREKIKNKQTKNPCIILIPDTCHSSNGHISNERSYAQSNSFKTSKIILIFKQVKSQPIFSALKLFLEMSRLT